MDFLEVQIRHELICRTLYDPIPPGVEYAQRNVSQKRQLNGLLGARSWFDLCPSNKARVPKHIKTFTRDIKQALA